ncbi:MAG: hypothetical protein A2V70_13825 [Planctomycetes bacterium RBG_13_63_9]|nr:MAG: hypothetical protein A2V70_13825 [Planctomycetes bacterium RBG_13_63_9]
MPRRQLRERFEALARTWRNECRFSSSMTEIAMHPAYQQIIGMGRDAVEFLLQELDRQPDHWFWALCAITGEDPVPPEDKGDLAAMAKVWLHWGKEHHYV